MSTQRHFIIPGGLAAIWCFLSGHFTAFLLTLGALSCLISYVIYQRAISQQQHQTLAFNPIRQLSYLVWLLGEIFKANLDVIGAIFNPGKIASQLFRVKTTGLDEQGRVIYANSITLTPGTVSTDVGQNEIQVHALLTKSKSGLMDDKMLVKVQKLASN